MWKGSTNGSDGVGCVSGTLGIFAMFWKGEKHVAFDNIKGIGRDKF